jgi:hypothetical protein
VRSPNPTEVIREGPITKSAELFGAPRGLVVILGVVTKTLREETLAIIDPGVNVIR